ncbi:MAG: type II secretion system F family protein [Opitutaceae bacterium]
MPLGHRKLALWYLQLAQQLEAGLPMAAALRSSLGTGAPAAEVEGMAAQIERGGLMDDALRATGRWLPFADRLALSAAVEAGQMPRTLRQLAARHEQMGAAQLRLILACAYPLLVVHAGVLLLPVVRMIDWEKGFRWDAAGYLRMVAIELGVLWGIIGALVFLVRRENPVLRWMGGAMPGLRGYIKAQALADFSFVLGNFLEAGVPIGPAWAAAGLLTRSPELKAAAQAMDASIARGEPPGPKLAAWKCFPADFAALYRTGEATGQLEANLLRLTTQNQEVANRALTFVTFLYPALLFMVVAGAVAYFVISIYAGYLKMLGKLME